MSTSVLPAGKAAARRAERVRQSIALFAVLPDDARVVGEVFDALSGLGRSARYARSADGLAPPIEKLAGGRASGMRVAEVRRFLADPAAYRAPGR